MVGLRIKGVEIGAGRPKTIVSLMARDAGSLLAAADQACLAGADCVEWRADFAEDPLDLDVMGNMARRLADACASMPVIFTFRSKGQGGQRSLAASDYVRLLRHIAGLRCVDVVDVELSLSDDEVRSLVSYVHEYGAKAIVSHHDFACTPAADEMEALLLRMAGLGADIPKLAVMANESLDCLRLMEATERAAQKLDVPLVTMAMGRHGVFSRLAGEAFGSAMTFCAVGEPSAPGQVGLAEARKILESLHSVL